MRSTGPHAAALYRNPRYSPQRHLTNDRAILDATALALERHGWTVVRADERDVERGAVPEADVYVNMCQGVKASEVLLCALGGAFAVNAPAAVLGCHRHRLAATLRETRLPFPDTVLRPTVDGAAAPPDALVAAGNGHLWVKRGDVHAEGPEDVVATDAAGLHAAIATFARRGIARVALQAHVPGPVVKFYAVADGRFFRWYFADPSSAIERDAVDETRLQDLAFAAADAVGLRVFGGDVVLRGATEPVLIDLNDWPSFAPVREDAAVAIASYLHDQARIGRTA